MGGDTTATLFFDGACSICRREVAQYRRLDRAGRLSFVDINHDMSELETVGVDFSTALRRMHARDRHGTIQSGVAAFAALWRELPYYRRLVPVIMIPPVRWLGEAVYLAWARLRPRLTGQHRGCAEGAACRLDNSGDIPS